MTRVDSLCFWRLTCRVSDFGQGSPACSARGGSRGCSEGLTDGPGTVSLVIFSDASGRWILPSHTLLWST